MIEIIKYSSIYEEELYNFVFDIMITNVKKESNALIIKLVDLNNVEKNYKGNFWIVIESGKIIGSIGLLKNNSIGIIKRFYISSEYRRKGIGTLLYNQLEKTAIKMKIKELQLSAGINLENAHNFYEKQGFICYGIYDEENSYRYKKQLKKLLERN